MTVSSALVYALLLAFQLAGSQIDEFAVDVVRDGRLDRELRLERGDSFDAVYSADGELLVEFEPSRRYPEIYTVYLPEEREPRTVNMREALIQIRSLATHPSQRIEAGGDQLEIGGTPLWRVRARPRLIFLGGEFFETMLLIHSSCHM